MKIAVHVQEIRETVEVQDAAEALRLLKEKAAERAPMLLRGVIRSLSDLNFAGEIVKRANVQEKRNDALPGNAQEFLEWAVKRGYATVLEE